MKRFRRLGLASNVILL